jgi:hypothetical protein
MIHRDHRQHYESASALGQILHREGPNEMTIGDIDLYCLKKATRTLRLFEHKQPDQGLGIQQSSVLWLLDRAIKSAAQQYGLGSESGVYIIQGALDVATESNKSKVDFAGQQLVKRLDGTTALTPANRKEFYDWLNCGPNWTSRANRGRKEWT